MNDNVKDIKQFIVNNFLFGDDSSLQENTSFMQSGIIDSTGILELVTHIEQTYNIKIHDQELVPENMDSINNIGRFLSKKLPCAE